MPPPHQLRGAEFAVQCEVAGLEGFVATHTPGIANSLAETWVGQAHGVR